MNADTRFAAYPSAVVYAEPDGSRPIQHLIWGDWLRLEGDRAGDFFRVHARGVDGWMHEGSFQKERLLEITFVDIGQGDGSLLVTPEDEHLIIDAGVADNMSRFLRWRYGGFEKPFHFEAAIITHPDSDHYGGFGDIFVEPNVTLGTLYHNGIVERNGPERLGPRSTSGRPRYLTDLVSTTEQMRRFLDEPSRWRGRKYPELLHQGLSGGTFSEIRMISTRDGFLPGFGPEDELTLEVLGPLCEDFGGQPHLQWLGSIGKTKNGHSVVLRGTYRKVRFLLGGDLNTASQKLLLRHYTQLDPEPRSLDDYQALLAAARRTFEVDVAKACHHGSSDLLTLFLDATNPIATVISSGDDEPHCHPRPDALGATGLYSRGTRPLIFSTELARSTKETLKHPTVLRHRLRELRAKIEEAPTETAFERRRKKRLIREFDQLVDSIERSVAVFGAIHLRTDGRRVVIAQKLERPRRKDQKWFVSRLEPEGTGPLRYIED